mgnify:FL=1|tara:strand:- start:1368 stop:2606 length:1239 start_codon:yes stop_codon:yes gene_type:complete
MAIKFPKIKPVAGEACHPDDMNDNVSEFVNEINGNLDSDNFSSDTSFGKELFKSDCFNKVYVFSKKPLDIGYRIRVPHSTTSFVKKCHKVTDAIAPADTFGSDAEYSEASHSVGEIEVTADHEGFLIIDFQGSIVWKGSGIVDVEHLHSHHCKMHMGFWPTEDGRNPQLANTGFFNPDLPAGGWCGISGKYPGSDTTTLDATGIERLAGVGTHPFESNLTMAETKAETMHPTKELPTIQHQNFPQGMWSHSPVDHYAVQFRIVMNGNVVAESGFLYNGNASYGFHLSGVTPVTAGSHTVDVEVRGVDIRHSPASRIGLGALDEEMIPGLSNPELAAGVDENFSPLPEYDPFGLFGFRVEEFLHDFEPAFGDWYGHVNTEDRSIAGGGFMYNFSTGIACDIEDRLLMVQYRKR